MGRYMKLAERTLGSREERREAAAAWAEFRETVALSDGWLLGMITGFVTLGHTYPIKRQAEIYVGVVLFILCFLVYMWLKAQERARKNPLLSFLERLD
mmetsp:Transcript_4239/g.7199  ORF Transcript_4239/g.7199 Transcript_4239/m.7199 type:complete len:98 (-) Transcript_4239:59-352(-)